MFFKKLLIIICPPIIKDFCIILKNNLRNPFNKKSTISKIKIDSENFCIIANGPSLNQSIEKYKNFFCKTTSLIVNDFPQSDLFQMLKPDFYLLLDPNYFSPLEELSSYDKETCLKTCNMFLDKINWNITVLLPYRTKKGWFENKISSNAFVSIAYFNNSDLAFAYNQKTKFKCWDKNLLPVPGQTVINTALYLSLYWNVRNTYLFGIDSDFFSSLEVDQETNVLYNTFNHFYGKERKIVYKDHTETSRWDYAEYTTAFAKMFMLYKELRNYADYKGLNVFNSSEFSMVDVFERRKPKD